MIMDAAQALVGLIILSIIVEFLVARIKKLIPKKKIGELELATVYATIIGLVIAFVTKYDLLALCGFPSDPIIGEIITGLAISGGSSVAHEFVAKLRESRTTNTDGTIPQ